MPKTSVLMPIYNVERYVREALISVADQTLGDIEVICINDGSTDASRAIVADFCKLDKRFRLIDKPNSGYGASMNRGLSEAQGDYLAILEPDDIYEPTALETLYAAAQATRADVIKANYWFFWSEPQPKNKLIQVVKPEWLVKVNSQVRDSDISAKFSPDGADPLAKDFTAVNFAVVDPYKLPEVFFMIPSIWSALYSSSYLKRNRIRFLETPGASFQDLSFTFKVFAYTHRVCLLDVPILHYRQDNESSSVNNPDKAFCVFDELQEVDRSVADLLKLDQVTQEQRNQMQGIVHRLKYDNYLWNYQRLSKKDRFAFLQKAVTDLKSEQDRGFYDRSLFLNYQAKNHELMLGNPEKFDRIYPMKPTTFAKAWYYFKLGGPRALVEILGR